MKTVTYEKSKAFHVLVPAAGKGERMKGDIPKQYSQLHGKSLIRYTVETLLQCPGLQSLRVIIDPQHSDLYHEAVKGLDLAESIIGSNTRKNSVLNGLKSFSNLKNEEKVLIHDAARPFVQTGDIIQLVDTLESSQAASLAVPVNDTLRRSSHQTVDRDGLWAMQTPQGFHYGTLKQAHEQFQNDDHFTDDAGMVSALGIDVTIVPGHRGNFKITDPEDLELAAKLLAPPPMISRTGFGYDVHAFDDAAPGPVRLCGIDIEHDKSLKGHSDADVGLHAITDALLGTIADGDIGSHFPPSDPQWKNADSKAFLKHATELVQAQNGRIDHIDLTLICELPKIGPHRDVMRTAIAETLDIDIRHVSLKATTTEGLGFTGRGEGIAAQAVATVSFPYGS